MLGRSIRCKIFGDDHQKKQSPNCIVIVKRPPAGREEVDGRERTNHIVSEKECRIMKKRKWAA